MPDHQSFEAAEQTTVECISWIGELNATHRMLQIHSTGPVGPVNPDGSIPYDPATGSPTAEYLRRADEFIAAHWQKTRGFMHRIEDLKDKIRAAAPIIMDAAALQEVNVGYAKFREFVDEGGLGFLNEPGTIAAKNELDLLRRRLGQLASKGLPSASPEIANEPTLDAIDRAIGLLTRAPSDMSDAQIAKQVGCHPSTLSRSERYQKVRAAFRGAAGSVRRGRRDDRTGQIEAEDQPSDDT